MNREEQKLKILCSILSNPKLVPVWNSIAEIENDIGEKEETFKDQREFINKATAIRYNNMADEIMRHF